jgi:hypothetical protein
MRSSARAKTLPLPEQAVGEVQDPREALSNIGARGRAHQLAGVLEHDETPRGLAVSCCAVATRIK